MAESKEMRDNWMKALNYCIKFSRESIKGSNKGSIIEEKAESWRAKNLDQKLLISLEAEKEIKDLENKPSDEDDYNTILKAKGIYEYIKRIEPAVLNSRICLGDFFLIRISEQKG